MIKVLYCHGMGGSGLNTPKVLQIFKSYGIDLVSPTINHSFFIDNPYIFDTMKELANDVDMIVGNSMGGFFAYHLGKACGKPTLCFNPAISEMTTSYNWFNNVTNYEPNENQKRTLIYMATDDDVVDHYHGTKFVKQNGFDTDEIEHLQDETHGLPFELIFEKILEFSRELNRETEKIN